MIVCVFVVSVRSRPSEAQIVSPFPFRPLLCESHLFQSKTPLWFGDLHRQVVPRAARSKDSSVQQLAYMSSFVDIFPTAFDSFGFCFLGGTVSLSFPCSQSVFVDHPLLFSSTLIGFLFVSSLVSLPSPTSSLLMAVLVSLSTFPCSVPNGCISFSCGLLPNSWGHHHIHCIFELKTKYHS